MFNQLLLRLIIALVVVSLAYLVHHYYNSDNSQIIVIYPDSSPTKIKPQESGGIVIPNADNMVYENLQQKQISKNIVLQAEPEKPLNIITHHQTAQNNDEFDPINDILSSIIEVDKLKQQENQSNSTKTENDIILPNIIKNEVRGQDFSTEQQLITTSQSLNHNKTGLNIVKVTNASRKIEKTPLNKARKNGYQIQLASVRSELDAIQEGERIKKKYPKILNDDIIKIKKIKSSKGSFFYLVIAGSYDNINQAKAVCKKLSSNQQDCVIAK